MFFSKDILQLKGRFNTFGKKTYAVGWPKKISHCFLLHCRQVWSVKKENIRVITRLIVDLFV
jgi:hypothetical protein